MAAKRIGQSSVNWAAFAERVPSNQKSNFITLKSKSDGYLRRVLANPPEPPKIDWSFYKSKIPNAALVDSLQKQYESIKVPYPADTATSQIESEAGTARKAVADFKAEMNSKIAEFQKEIARIEALIPYDQMTMEDFRDAHPELALDPINKPTFWPHDPAHQPPYDEAKEAALRSH